MLTRLSRAKCAPQLLGTGVLAGAALAICECDVAWLLCLAVQDCAVRMKLVAPPLYVLTTQTLDKNQGIEVLKTGEQLHHTLDIPNSWVIVCLNCA